MVETELAFARLSTSLQVKIAILGQPHAIKGILHAQQHPLRHTG
jgi:hypothetical protein